MSGQPEKKELCVCVSCWAFRLLTSLWSSTTLSNVSMVFRMPIAVTALSSPPSSSGPVWITWLNVIACQSKQRPLWFCLWTKYSQISEEARQIFHYILWNTTNRSKHKDTGGSFLFKKQYGWGIDVMSGKKQFYKANWWHWHAAPLLAQHLPSVVSSPLQSEWPPRCIHRSSSVWHWWDHHSLSPWQCAGVPASLAGWRGWCILWLKRKNKTQVNCAKKKKKITYSVPVYFTKPI